MVKDKQVIRCKKCGNTSDQWWNDLGIRLVKEDGSSVVYCKNCFRLWLLDEDEVDINKPTDSKSH